MTYIPFGLELFQVLKLGGNGLVRQERFVLAQRSLAYLGIFCLGDGVLQKRFFELVKCHYDAE